MYDQAENGDDRIIEINRNPDDVTIEINREYEVIERTLELKLICEKLNKSYPNILFYVNKIEHMIYVLSQMAKNELN